MRERRIHAGEGAGGAAAAPSTAERQRLTRSPLTHHPHRLHRPSYEAAAAPAAAETSLQVRGSRLEEMHKSLYYVSECIWLQVMDRVPYALSHYLVPSLSPHHELMLSRVRDTYVHPYSTTRPADVELLGRLWNGHNRVVFAPETLAFSPASHAVSERWKELGFQGTDPSTDFRGAGAFGLMQLVYLVEKHPEQWNQILTPDFLAAAAGINVTLRLVTLLGINTSVNQFSASAHATYSAREAQVQLCRFIFNQDVDVAVQRLHEVYCFALRLLHYRWRHSSRNIMEFNQLLNAMYAELEQLLFSCTDLTELCSIL